MSRIVALGNGGPAGTRRGAITAGQCASVPPAAEGSALQITADGELGGYHTGLRLFEGIFRRHIGKLTGASSAQHPALLGVLLTVIQKTTNDL